MRSFGAVALFTLAVVTECLAAHSDRSRQRSSPIRSVPVAANVKRDVDFDCPEEFGYYSHPTDCTLYYVCVFGGALLESCTGGLMYSHELQTCDWPRNVGCDGTSAFGGEEIERISEREPPPPPPPRRRPPSPPRAQPNPVVTSRGQPKYIRDEYEKQQQLYAEVDDLPPVEEIESDRQQRVNRGQPPTIGQVQKDRDGYGTQVVSSGRNFNSNIIPASIPQNSGKLGSFSFGSQADDRRTATATQAPRTYSEIMTDCLHDRQLDIETNEIDNDVTKTKSRRKREVKEKDLGVNETSTLKDEITKRSGSGEEMEYFEIDPELIDVDNGEDNHDDSERGKRQIRYFLKNGYKNAGKNWANAKPVKIVELQHQNYNPREQNIRNQQLYSGLNNNNYYEGNRRPFSFDNNLFSTANPFIAYQSENLRPFKASFPDPSNQRLAHNPLNAATQIITKSPPISSLKNNGNPFSSLAGGFYNNLPSPNSNQNNNQHFSQTASTLNHPNNQFVVQDSSLLPSTIVTGKPVPTPNSLRPLNNYRDPEQNQKNRYPDRIVNQKQVVSKPTSDDEEDEDDEDDYDSSEEDSDRGDEDKFKYNFPKPPYEFTHPNHKYAKIENPFANPNFDFDAFLTKLSNGQYSIVSSTPKPKLVQNAAVNSIRSPIEVTTASNIGSGIKSSTINYKGMSTPMPFTIPAGSGNSAKLTDNNYRPHSTKQPELYQQLIQRPQPSQQSYPQQQQQQQLYNENSYSRVPQQNAGVPLEAVRPKLKPPNFKDDRQLPINYSFNRPIGSTSRPNYDHTKYKGENQQVYTVTQKPYVFVTSSRAPLLISTPKQKYEVKPEKIVSLQPTLVPTGKPYLLSSVKPHNIYTIYKHSTAKPLTTVANEQLSALQHYWNNPSSDKPYSIQTVTFRPSTPSFIPKQENTYSQTIRPSVQAPVNQNSYTNTVKSVITTTIRPLPKRRPIPKPSPEMNDYYYDEDDEQYYYEPPVKPKYMPSTEVKPQRPPIAQNYKEYDDSSSYEDSGEEQSINIKSPHPIPSKTQRRPVKYTFKPETITKNHNDVSVVTKAPLKDYSKNIDGKIPVPVLVDYATPAPTVLLRPELSNYDIVHHVPRNRTVHIRKPTNTENGPYTNKPPKYLNQTTLRPYTVRHRLAKPTTVKAPSTQNDEITQTRGRQRHPNIVAQMKLTTPRDNFNQETRFTKNRHDDKTNSLEPTERVPASYSASPRPKMLYNGSQSYIPDQYDPYYAVYDEDGELYKDADYVQQYNTASLRPAVQQTYRGTPPPPRRPVETYSPRPVSPDDYDDALIQGQISNQNQYQSPIRHSTRGEGNELGYDHNPSSVRTTVYEATTISTTPPTTTSTSTTTTQRPTTAPFTEAMTPSRYTPRLSSDESPSPKSESPSIPSEEPPPAAPSTRSSFVNFSALAKPFERTDNTHRLREILPTTEKLPTPRRSSSVTNNNKLSVNVERPVSNTSDKKKVVSLTTGFSIRRNSSNTNNPYTLTVLTRPLDEYNQYRKSNIPNHNDNRKSELNRYKYDSGSDSHEKSVEVNSEVKSSNERSSESSIRRKDSVLDVSDDDDIPIFVRPTRLRISKPQARIQSTSPPTTTTKYYLKTVIKRPASFSNSDEVNVDSTENTINTEALIETALHNARNNKPSSSQNNNPYRDDSPIYESYENSRENWNPVVSPYRTLDNLRGSYKTDDFVQDRLTSTTSTTRLTTTTPKEIISRYLKRDKISRPKPSYYSYRLEDDIMPDQTTEVFSGKVTNVIKAFLNNFVSTSAPYLEEEFLNTPPPTLPTTTSTTSTSTTTTTTTTTTPIPLEIEDKIVNIGYQKKIFKYVDEKPLRSNVKRLQIITEPSIRRYIQSGDTIKYSHSKELDKDFSSTTPSSTTVKSVTYKHTSPETTPMMVESSTNEYRQVYGKDTYQSKFNAFITSKPIIENTNKFHSIVNEDRSPENSNRENNLDNATRQTKTTIEATKTPTETEPHTSSKVENDIASTTSTTKSTTTIKIEPTTSTTKSISFPTRASRVNPAIKLAATNPGGGRRSYQSSSKCSSDNSLQANPKCNEIKYQRPTSTRGRGSAHYSTGSGSDAPPPAPNRGTPPTRSRPTLKPSTAIVTKTVETADIYAHPPGRPAPVYPQPTPDKTAAKCRKDVCLLPDCYCGGKDIPGELPVETVPQIVILTFDDSVNDLNKGLYTDLFEKGRVNPNGCPISATFYVSHEWTDYSQVQNLYSAGHEMASHTVSHSFGEQFSQKKWNREVGGQREILAAYGGVKLEDVRGMRAPFLSVGGNKMFKMLYDSNFTYDSSLPVYENRPPSWPYTLDYKLFHDCMIPPCPTKSYPGVWEVPMVMWQDLNGGRCSMGDACANPSEAEGVYKMILKNFDRHYTTNRAPFGLYYHAAWFTQPHHKEGFIMFLDFINKMQDVWIVTNWQALQWVRDPTPISRMNNFQPFQCNYQDRPKKCNNPKVCNLWHKSGVRYMRTCQPCPEIYPWTGKTGIRSSRIDNDISE